MFEFDFENKTYIRFSAGSDPISWAIQARTGCQWSHSDFLLPSGQLLGALPGGGVQMRSAIRGEVRSAIYEVPIKNGFEFFLSQIGKPYDYTAVCGLALPFPRNWNWDESKWFCSEGIAASLLRQNFPIVNPEIWGITPRYLLLSRYLKQVG